LPQATHGAAIFILYAKSLVEVNQAILAWSFGLNVLRLVKMDVRQFHCLSCRSESSNISLVVLRERIPLILKEHPAYFLTQVHRVGRMLSLISSRSNWDPLTRRRVCLPPFGSEAHSLAGERVGESQFRRGDIHCVPQYIYVLCAQGSRPTDPGHC
jgi:hypothetical protein